MKRLIILLMPLVLFLTMISSPVYAEELIPGYIDGKVITFTIQPIIENNTAFLPFGETFRALGYEDRWDAKTQLLTAIKNGGLTIQFKTNELNATWVNGKKSKLTVPNKVINGTLFVSLQSIKQTTGKNVYWDAKKRAISIADPPRYIWLRKALWEDENGNYVELPHLAQAIFVSFEKEEGDNYGLPEVFITDNYMLTIVYNGKKYYDKHINEWDLQFIYFSYNPFAKYKWSKATWDLVKQEQIKIGMNQDMVRVAWGEPYDINESVGSWGNHEQWIYGKDISFRNYLYFENGVLTAIQD